MTLGGQSPLGTSTEGLDTLSSIKKIYSISNVRIWVDNQRIQKRKHKYSKETNFHPQLIHYPIGLFQNFPILSTKFWLQALLGHDNGSRRWLKQVIQ